MKVILASASPRRKEILQNTKLNFDIQKHTVRDGKYSDEVKSKLHEAANWLQNKTQNHMITIIPFLQYHTSKAIKEIRKYAALGVKYFILDTFKMDAGKVGNNSWLEMQQSMVDIKDVIKSEALNVHILITDLTNTIIVFNSSFTLILIRFYLRFKILIFI